MLAQERPDPKPAAAVAGAEAAFQATMEYVKERKAFGRRRLRIFRNTRFKLAEIAYTESTSAQVL